MRIVVVWPVIATMIGVWIYMVCSPAGWSSQLVCGFWIVLALLFFGSVLTHELAHAVTARRRGIPVRGITLFLFGGATHAKAESKGPGEELVIAGVGPLTSLVLGGLFLLLGYGGTDLLGRPLAGGFRYLGVVNLMLAVFNMLPGFPLDGGRVLRAIVWRVTGSLARATRVASIAGQVVGYLLVGVGVVFLTQGVVVSAIWLASIGWFLAQAASNSYEELQIRRMLETVDAEDLMSPELVSVPADLPLRPAVDEYFMRFDHGAFPVEDDGRTVGLLTLRGVKRIPQAEWDRRTVGDSMEPIGEQCSVDASARMDQVLSKVQEGGGGRCLVLRDGQVVGIITRSDIARWLERRRALRA
jgi:Zn-dependent protease/predicted transcriptional regulator